VDVLGPEFLGIDAGTSPADLKPGKLAQADNARPHKELSGVLGPRRGREFLNTTETDALLALMSTRNHAGNIVYWRYDDQGALTEIGTRVVTPAEVDYGTLHNELTPGLEVTVTWPATSNTADVTFSREYPIDRYRGMIGSGLSLATTVSGPPYLVNPSYQISLGFITDLGGYVGSAGFTFAATKTLYSSASLAFPNYAAVYDISPAASGQRIVGARITLADSSSTPAPVTASFSNVWILPR
jgi:hypothetical protein